MTAIVKITAKGQTTIPQDIRADLWGGTRRSAKPIRWHRRVKSVAATRSRPRFPGRHAR